MRNKSDALKEVAFNDVSGWLLHWRLERGADLNSNGKYYHIKVVRFLLGRNGGFNIPPEEYGEAISAAAGEGHMEMVKALILAADAGVKMEAEDYGGALYGAASGGHSKIVKLLMDYGTGINSQVEAYSIALCSAVNIDEGDDEGISVFELLLDAGEDVNIQREESTVPLSTLRLAREIKR